MIAVAVWIGETVLMMIGAVVVGTLLSSSTLGMIAGVLLAAVLIYPASRRLLS